MLLHDVVIAQHASEKAVLDEGAISELRGVYPDAHMIDDLGDAPGARLVGAGMCMPVAGGVRRDSG